MLQPPMHIAQLNLARAVDSLDSPMLADFVAALAQINALADASPGFVWRLQSNGDDATAIRVNDDPRLIVNMSVWTSIEALFDYVYRSAHTKVMAQRRRWFEKPAVAHQVLWWIPAGHEPLLNEGIDRLEHLRKHGPSQHAFTFKQRFAAHGAPENSPDMDSVHPLCQILLR